MERWFVSIAYLDLFTLLSDLIDMVTKKNLEYHRAGDVWSQLKSKQTGRERWLPLPSSGKDEYCRPHLKPTSSWSKNAMCVSCACTFLHRRCEIYHKFITQVDFFFCVIPISQYLLYEKTHFLLRFKYSLCLQESNSNVLVQTVASSHKPYFLYSG